MKFGHNRQISLAITGRSISPLQALTSLLHSIPLRLHGYIIPNPTLKSCSFRTLAHTHGFCRSSRVDRRFTTDSDYSWPLGTRFADSVRQILHCFALGKTETAPRQRHPQFIALAFFLAGTPPGLSGARAYGGAAARGRILVPPGPRPQVTYTCAKQCARMERDP